MCSFMCKSLYTCQKRHILLLVQLLGCADTNLSKTCPCKKEICVYLIKFCPILYCGSVPVRDMTNVRLWLCCVGLQEVSAEKGLPLLTAEFLLFTQRKTFS